MGNNNSLKTPLQRILFNSPLKQGKVIFLVLAVLLLLFAWSYPQFRKYYLQAPMPMMVGLITGFIVYSPTLFVLAFMTRRKRVPGILFWGVPLSVILFFGPVTSHTNGWFRAMGISDYLFVGISEETWKIMPLLLIILFARPAITGVRDGVLYGALGGFGFACLEMASYFALVEYPQQGWNDFFVNILSRATYLGTDLHIVFSAFLGGAMVWGLKMAEAWKRIAIPMAGYVLVVVTHGIQDSFGKLLSVLPTLAVAKLAMALGGTEETIQPYLVFITMFGATVNLLAINIVILPLLIWMVFRDGDRERATILHQLMDEPVGIV
ncbi:PrsW family glutamic-type intramembrane protease, partial [Thiolapillus sp.]